MDIYPAVDILEGRCVQLVQGRRDSAEIFGDPVSCAMKWIDEGAGALHVINLDGAFGSAHSNAEWIRKIIRETGVTIQLGGGIRSVEDATSWLGIGVERVILGTLAIREPESIRTLAGECGREAVMAGVDARGGQVVVEGWVEEAGDFLDWAQRFEDLGAGSLLYTNVDVEGMCRGVAREPVDRLLARVSVPVVIAGGITGVGDLAMLKEAGAAGAVLGSALYKGKLTLREALEAAQ